MNFHFKPNPGPEYREDNRAIDAIRLDDLVASNIETLCAHFFPEGRRVNGRWRVASTPRIGAKKSPWIAGHQSGRALCRLLVRLVRQKPWDVHRPAPKEASRSESPSRPHGNRVLHFATEKIFGLIPIPSSREIER
jgi:hypothetical protein